MAGGGADAGGVGGSGDEGAGGGGGGCGGAAAACTTNGCNMVSAALLSRGAPGGALAVHRRIKPNAAAALVAHAGAGCTGLPTTAAAGVTADGGNEVVAMMKRQVAD